MPASEYRYQLQPYKGPATRSTCPSCGKQRVFTAFVDTRTGEILPGNFGRCDRQDNCGYYLSPYHASAGGTTYADEVYQQERAGNTPNANFSPSPRFASAGTLSAASENNPTSLTSPSSPKPLLSIPEKVFKKSLGNYENNTFARLLRTHFGMEVADELLNRFQVGTSSFWPGAAVFWLIDEESRVRGGQVALFEADGHTAKRPRPDGTLKRCTSWVHTAIATLCDRQPTPRPTWLNPYIEQGDFAPCLFGLPQLRTAPLTQPVAIVEAPKTAVLCTPYFPGFLWLAVGALDWLNVQRLAPLRGRKVFLFPDLSNPKPNEPGKLIKLTAFENWTRRADNLRTEGFQITISDFIEKNATDEQRAAQCDIADFLLDQWEGYPPSWN